MISKVLCVNKTLKRTFAYKSASFVTAERGDTKDSGPLTWLVDMCTGGAQGIKWEDEGFLLNVERHLPLRPWQVWGLCNPERSQRKL